jgi:hypothetical protein
MKNEIKMLLEKIYYYYPIGIPSLINSHEGKTLIRKMTEKKINEIILKEATPWASFIKELKDIHSEKIFDMGYEQFPSYIATIDLKKDDNDFFHFTRKITINISLLCLYYTIFFEDYFLFSYGESEFDNPNFRIFFSKNSSSKNENFIPIIQSVERFFPNHIFINHKLLFEYKISGLPYSHEMDLPLKPYPFYSFLFDPYLILDNLTVL